MSGKRILVIGVGSIGERHVRCFQQTGRASLAIADTNERLRLEVSKRYGNLDAYDRIENALQSQLDGAVICTPAHLHIPMARQLAEAGIPVLIEKPLSTDLSGVSELLQVIEKRQLPAAAAYVIRHHPALAAMRDALQSGQYGKPVQLVANCGQSFPTYRPAYRDIYYADRATGGGAIQDALTHVVNAAQWLLGPVTKVAADAAHQVLEGVTVEDTAHVLARHEDVLAVYSLNQYQAPNEWTITVVCTGATLRFEYHHCRFRWMIEPDAPWQEKSFGPIERDTLFIRQAEGFLSTLSGTAPACSITDAVQTLKATMAILTAAETRKWIDV